MINGTYFLSSLESARFEPVRKCRFVRRLSFDTGKVAIEVHLSPAVIGQEFNRADVDTVILTPRHEGVTIDPISEFPCFVFIAIPLGVDSVPVSPIRSAELEIIGWGELYRTEQDAAAHKFD